MRKCTLKIFTPQEQYQNLVTRGLIMDENQDNILQFLTHQSYIILKSYFSPYYQTNHSTFIEGTKWSTIVQYYQFDRELRLLIFSYISFIENSFKNLFCQFTCQELGNVWRGDKKSFRIPSSYRKTFWNKIFQFIKLGSSKKYPFQVVQVFDDIIKPKIKNIASGKEKNEHIKKYLSKYDYPKIPPFRVMIQVFTFGEVAHMYNFLDNQHIKKKIGEQYEVDDKVLQNRIKVLVDARNICCHHSKLYDKKNRMIIKAKSVSRINTVTANYEGSTYHLCCIIHYLLSYIQPENNFKKDFKTLLTKYPTVPILFPDHWEELRT